jgi:YVTN family beta-propeller protein
MRIRRFSGLLLIAIVVGYGPQGFADEATASESKPLKKVEPGRVWIANRIPGSIDLFDARSGTRLDSVRVGDGTLDIALPAGAGKIYASDESSGTISVVDVNTRQRVAVIPTGLGSKPHHMDANPDGSLVYASLFGTNKIAAVDTATDTLAWEVTLGPAGARVHGTAINAAGGTLWVTNGSGGSYFAIHELDAHTGIVRRTKQVDFDWSEVALGRNETTLLGSDKTNNRIRVFDIATLEEIGSAPVPQTPDTMSLTNDGKTLLVGLRGNPATCAFVDLETLTTTALSLSTGAGTSTGHHDLSSNSKWGFISVDGANAPPHIAVLDMESQTVHSRWDDPGRPHGVIFDPLAETQE